MIYILCNVKKKYLIIGSFTLYLNAISHLSIYNKSGCEPSHQKRSRCTNEGFSMGTLYSWHGNIVFLTNRLFDVAKFNFLTPLSLLSWCRLLFLIIGLKIFPLCIFAIKSPNTIFMLLRKMIQKSALILHKHCLLNHHFSPHLLHIHSEQWYYTSNLSELYMTPYH